MTDIVFNEMFKMFKKAGQDVLIMNHYEITNYMKEELKYIRPIEDWKDFLSNPGIQEYIKTEFAIIAESNMRKIIATVDEDDKSAGKAQLINAMLSATKDTSNKRDGNIIVYSYILPNEQQKKATNTQVITRDPFKEQ